MRASFVLSIACLALLAVGVVSSSASDLASDIEWIEPSFVESIASSHLPGVGGACGDGGRCVANGAACARPANTIVWSQCTVPAMCCVPTKAAASSSSTTAPAAGVWQAVRDPKTGRTYWYDSATKATTWTNPNNATPAAPAPAPANPVTPSTPTPAVGGAVQKQVAAYLACLRSKLGIPYLFGGDSDAGYDCSGLTSTCAAKAGVTIPRTARDQINTPGALHIPVANMQPGDLIFFGTGQPHHVASYIGKAPNGDSQFIEAQQTGTLLKVSLNMEKRRKDVLGVRRIFH